MKYCKVVVMIVPDGVTVSNNAMQLGVISVGQQTTTPDDPVSVMRIARQAADVASNLWAQMKLDEETAG